MKQIKTVILPMEMANAFDEEVNRLLKEGWTIKERMLTNTQGQVSEAFNTPLVQVLYAELEKIVPPYPEEITI